MRIAIGSPLEPEFVAAIAAVDPANVVEYHADLLPPMRYPSDHKGPPEWRRDPEAERRFGTMLVAADIIYGTPGDSGPGLASALALAPKVRWVAGTAAGAGEIVRAAGLRADVLERVAFTNAAGVHGGMLAEFVFGGLLALRKDFRRLDRIRAARGWDHYASGELAGSTIAIFGMGGIGRAIARRARAFEMRVIGVTRSGTPDADTDDVVTIAAMHSALAQADAVVTTLPATELTKHLIDARAIAAMKRDAIFANVGRGSIVDQAALIDALEDGRLAGAVLDVFDREPLPEDSPLWTMENVVFAPHTMALSVRENERIVALFCDNLGRLAAGEPLRNRIDVREFY